MASELGGTPAELERRILDLHDRPVRLLLSLLKTPPKLTKHLAGRDYRPHQLAPVLMEAARQGRDSAVRALLDRGAPVNFLDENGYSPLMAAAMGNRPETIRLLVQSGAEVDLAALPRGRTALIEAAWQEHPEAVRALLDCGADPNCQDSICGTAISDTQCCDCILHLARAGADLQQPRRRYQESLLAEAAAQGRQDLMEELLGRGAELDPGALVAALRSGPIKVAAWLLDHGADPNAASSLGELPMEAAAGRRGALSWMQLLLRRGAQVQRMGRALARAVQTENLEALEFLFELGVTPPEEGEPLLHLAAAVGKSRMVQRLLEWPGCQVDVPYLEGQTPLMRAATNGALKCVELLLKAGAGLELRDEHGRTALMHAAESGQVGAVERLLQAGANLESRDREGHTALQRAAASLKCALVVPALLKAGAKCDSPETLGMALGHYCDRDTVRALLEAGAPCQGALAEMCERAAWRPTWRERDARLLPVARLLAEHGEDPRHPSVLLYARVHAYPEFVAWLKQNGIGKEQIEAVEIPAYLGYDWH